MSSRCSTSPTAATLCPRQLSESRRRPLPRSSIRPVSVCSASPRLPAEPSPVAVRASTPDSLSTPRSERASSGPSPGKVGGAARLAITTSGRRDRPAVPEGPVAATGLASARSGRRRSPVAANVSPRGDKAGITRPHVVTVRASMLTETRIQRQANRQATQVSSIPPPSHGEAEPGESNGQARSASRDGDIRDQIRGLTRLAVTAGRRQPMPSSSSLSELPKAGGRRRVSQVGNPSSRRLT